MDGLKDYIEWLGDVDFSAKPFGEVDAVILCLISYFDLGPAESDAPGDDASAPFYLHDCLKSIEEGKLQLRITGGEDGNLGVFKAAAGSKRFGELAISNYVDRLEPENDLQFSAVTFSYKSEWSFIAFRGTDNTLVGWKEDLKIAYTQTEAQKLAFSYVTESIEPDVRPEAEERRRKIFRKVFFRRSAQAKQGDARRWYIGGHSKGGNLALFAACQLEGAVLDRVERVFNLDGPGFAPEVVDEALVKRIDPKTVRIIPEYSIIGRILESDATDTRIIKSSNSGVMQHSIASWGVDHGRLAMSELTEPKDRWLNETIRQWISSMSFDDRVVFIDELFDALEATGAATVDELAAMGKDAAEIIKEKYKGFSEPTRRTLGDLQSAAIESALKKLLGEKDSVLDSTKKVIADSTKKVISELGSKAAEAAESIMVQIQLQKKGKGAE